MEAVHLTLWLVANIAGEGLHGRIDCKRLVLSKGFGLHTNRSCNEGGKAFPLDVFDRGPRFASLLDSAAPSLRKSRDPRPARWLRLS